MSNTLLSVKTDPSTQVRSLRVSFNLDWDWQGALAAGAPNTSHSCNVRKAGDLYIPIDKSRVEEELVLHNSPKGGGSWENALAWAEKHKLLKACPRRIYAVGKEYPDLSKILEMDPMYLVATKKCCFREREMTVDLRFIGQTRTAHLAWTDYYQVSNAWFVFIKPPGVDLVL